MSKQHRPRTIYEGDEVTSHECDDCGQQGAYYPATGQTVGPLSREECATDE